MSEGLRPQVIRVRDVVRNEIHEMGPDEPVLRGPYDLFQPDGSVRRRGDVIDWRHRDQTRTARVVPATLGTTHPGERVLVRLPADVAPRAVHDPGDRAQPGEQEWWLCEVQAADGVAVS